MFTLSESHVIRIIRNTRGIEGGLFLLSCCNQNFVLSDFELTVSTVHRYIWSKSPSECATYVCEYATYVSMLRM